jgi:Cd2+/Zn2+-exporting ATPase
LPGVTSAKINFGASNMIIEGDVEPELVIKEAAKEGIGAKPLGQSRDDQADSFVQTYKDTIISVISGAALIAAWIAGLIGYSILSIPLYAASIIVGGFKPARSALYGIRKLNFDMNVLMTIAVIGAAAIGEWAEGALVAFLFSVSNTLSSYTMEKARDSIRALMDIAPKEATVVRGDREVRIPVEEIQIDDEIIVKPGEKIAMDGVVLRGGSSVNQAAITGESMPVMKEAGDEVFAGTLNQQGTLSFKVTKLAEDTTLSKIIHLVQEAQGQRAKSQAFVDRFSQYYTPLVMAAAIMISIVPPLVLDQSWDDWIYRGLALLIVACPCALIISTPVSLVASIGNAAKRGVLIKGGIFLEEAGTLKAVAFDKTGTLTVGRPEVTDIVPVSGISQAEILGLAASLEKRSEHPLAEAIVRRAEKDKVSFGEASDFSSITGKGAYGILDRITYYIGNPRLFTEKGADLSGCQELIAGLQQEGKTVMLLGTEAEIMGIIAVADEVRDLSAEAVARLKRAGIETTIMLTGDNEATARAIAQRVGIDEYRAELLPGDKVEAVKEIQRRYGKTAMVGDGINDAPAMAAANLGIAMGVAGTDTALETADIALMSDDLTKLPFLVRISRATLRIIQQNIWFSLIVKAVSLLLIFPGWLTLIVAILADVGASLLVTLNGLRLLGVKPEK